MSKRLNYQSLYDDMIAQRNTALARVALLEDEIVNYWEPANAAAIDRAAEAEAEVARLTADNAALRAQLEEAGWQPIHDTPPMGEVVQVRGRAQYVPTAWDVYLDEWRPAPPQE